MMKKNGRIVYGYELSGVTTITVDGKEIESCGEYLYF